MPLRASEGLTPRKFIRLRSVHVIAGTDGLQPVPEEAVYVLLDLDDLGAEAQLRPGHTIELSVSAVQAD